MATKTFNLLTISILVFGLIIRLLPLRHNNFYFTMDQGRDAIAITGITNYFHFPLLGPVTSIDNLYVGPLWYYFISIGFFLFHGHPIGPVILLIILNTTLTLIIIKRISKEISPKVGLVIGLALQFSWLFYDSSRYSFNPFPNTFLSFIALFWLCDFLSGKQNKFILAAIPIGLFIHTDIASSIPAIFFYLSIGAFGLFSKRLSIKHLVSGFIVAGLFALPHLISELLTGFSQLSSLIKEINNPNSVLSTSNPLSIKTILFILAAPLIYWGLITSKLGQFPKHFSLLCLTLIIINLIFFSTNSGWRDWQTGYLGPLAFVSIILVLTSLPSKLSTTTLIFFLVIQSISFIQKYSSNLHLADDPSLLANELKAIDYTYNSSGGNKFSTYIWIPSIFDHHYQYLFRWYGVKKYGHMPCEVNTYPKSPQTYLPNWYAPKLRPDPKCLPPLRYLIIEKDKNNSFDQTWYSDITVNTTLIDKTNIGKILIEKRQLNKK